MPEEYRNIYKSARRSAGLTQEAAAERLAVSVESLRAYETGGRIPPDVIVERMAICYNTQYLALQHLQQTNALAAQVMPEIEQRPLEKLALQFYVEMKRLETIHGVDRLMEICEDGVISPDEMSDLGGVLECLKRIAKTWLELGVLYSGEESP